MAQSHNSLDIGNFIFYEYEITPTSKLMCLSLSTEKIVLISNINQLFMSILIHVAVSDLPQSSVIFLQLQHDLT